MVHLLKDGFWEFVGPQFLEGRPGWAVRDLILARNTLYTTLLASHPASTAIPDYLRPMYASSAGNLLSRSSMLFMVRDARSMGLSAGGAGSACCCCGCGCDMEPVRVKPGRLGAGVLTKAPGVGRCGVAGAIWKAMMDSV